MDNQQYCLSLKLARLGGLVRSTLGIREIARQAMQQVNERTSETITLNTIVGTDRMVLEVVDTPSPLMSMARPGQQMPMFLGASSRILLAHMEPAELDRVLKVTAAGVDFDRAAFDRELARFKRQGYALTRGQRVSGLTAIAVPLFDIDGRVPHCLALTGPSVRVDPRDLDLAEIMIAAGRDISTRLGASPEHAIDLKLMMDDVNAEKGAPAMKRAAKKEAKKEATKQPRKVAPAVA
jgi:DNA-binding IclR family transcriptional regulator